MILAPIGHRVCADTHLSHWRQLDWVLSAPEVFDHINVLYDAVFGDTAAPRTAEEKQASLDEAVQMLRNRFPGAIVRGWSGCICHSEACEHGASGTLNRDSLGW